MIMALCIMAGSGLTAMGSIQDHARSPTASILGASPCWTETCARILLIGVAGLARRACRRIGF
jgi:hypothetical protein